MSDLLLSHTHSSATGVGRHNSLLPGWASKYVYSNSCIAHA